MNVPDYSLSCRPAEGREFMQQNVQMELAGRMDRRVSLKDGLVVELD
jgi:hypothetical protein